MAPLLVLTAFLGPLQALNGVAAADSTQQTEVTKVDLSTAKKDIRRLVSRIEDLSGKVQDLQVSEINTEIHIELAADVLFDFDKAEILPKAQSALSQTAAIIREKAKGTVRIEGHTDSKGSDAYNQKLSERRATAVKTWLVEKEGLQSVAFVAQAFGAKKPVAPNVKTDGSDNPEGRQKNRRVEIVLKK